jgi:hypothetical protein
VTIRPLRDRILARILSRRAVALICRQPALAAAERPSVALFMLATQALIAERPKHGTTASDQENS